MQFAKVFVERGVRDHPQTAKILTALGSPPLHLLDKIEDVFGRAYKPYLQKRTTLNLFIGRKEGNLLKKTPAAYGASKRQRVLRSELESERNKPEERSDELSEERLQGARKRQKVQRAHYFFYHSYNCIFECEYCYLQGYFSSPDLVFFVNHDEICADIESICLSESQNEFWFHAGEFSDSLALSHITQDLPIYWETFSRLDNGYLELRTKSANIKEVLHLPPLANIVVSFSLSPKNRVREFEHKTSSLRLRLQAIKKLTECGYRIGIHFDPIIYSEHIEDEYRPLLCSLRECIDLEQLAYLSLGVVRFSKEVFRAVQKNYPCSRLLGENFMTGTDDKVSYFRPKRLFVLNRVQELCLETGIPAAKIYFCMEESVA